MRTPLLLQILLFVGLSALYSASSQSVIGAVDGSQYALTLAIAREHRFAINSFAGETKHSAYAFRQGNIYSDRPPGLSLLAVPLDLVAGGLSTSAEDRNALSRKLVLLVPAIAGAAAVLLFARLLMLMGVAPLNAWTTALVLALATLHWKYATLFMAYGVLALWVTSLWVLIALPAAGRGTLRRIAFGFLLGTSMLLRYEAALLLPIFLAAWWITERGVKGTRTIFLAAAAPLSLLAFYQTVCFGAPWETYAAYYAPDRNYWNTAEALGRAGGAFTFAEMLSNPIVDGLERVLFQFPGPSRGELPAALRQGISWGIFVLQPVLLFSCFGLWRWFAAQPRLAALQLFMFLTLLLATAKNQSLAGGAMHDPRYLVAGIPLLLIPFAFFLESAAARIRSVGLREALFGLTCLVAVASFVLCFVHLAERNLDIALPAVFQQKYFSYISREFLRDLSLEVFGGADRAWWGAAAAGMLVAGAAVIRLLCTAAPAAMARIFLAMLALLMVGGGALTAYAYTLPGRAMSRFADTVMLDGLPAAVARQRDGFVLAGALARKSAPRAVRRLCRNPVLVTAPAELRLNLPRGMTSVSIWASQAASRGALRLPRGKFEVKADAGAARIFPRIGGRRPWRRISYSLPQSGTLVFRFGSSRSHGFPGIWCVRAG